LQSWEITEGETANMMHTYAYCSSHRWGTDLFSKLQQALF
jgi:hypothetical protein